MKWKIGLSFFSVLQGLILFAQKPEDRLSQRAQKSPIEKIFLHSDRDSYIAGETVWFKAYLSSEGLPDTISTTLYVELIRTDLSVISRKILPVLLAASAGQMELPDSLSSGIYTLRAFTPAMANQSPDFIYIKGIYIYGKKKEEAPAIQPKIKIEFFPEGGNLMTGLSNTIAFKATYDNGLPAPVSGTIKNSKGEELTSFTEYYDGMGMFELTPAHGEKYFAVTPDGQFELPASTEKGIVLTVMPHPQGNFFEIQSGTADPAFVPAYMIGQMQHRVLFRQNFNAAKESLQGVINTQGLHSGIMQVTVFSKEGMPLAERLCFVNNNEYRQLAELLTDTVDFSTGGRNRFRIAMNDTVQGNISVSITDADYGGLPGREENIITTMLLTSDIKGYVHHPAYYFSADNDSVKTAMDLLMMTNGWRRFKWTELVKQPLPAFSNPAYISLGGKATLKGTNRPFSDKTLLLMISSRGEKKSRSTHLLTTDKEGNFLIDSLVFFDRNRLLFSDVRGKKSQYIDVTLKEDSLNRPFTWAGFSPAQGKIFPASNTAGWQMDYDAILKENGVMLEGVTVKVNTKTPLEQVEERYTSGLFSGDANRTIDLINSDEATPYNNIFDYLQFRVNGLQVVSDGAEYALYYRQGASMSSMGNIAMTIFLDEIETDASVLATIPANQVALVKVHQSFAGAAGNAPGGVLSVYTKKGEDYSGGGIFANLAFYQGYSVVKEFYEPDYKVKKGNAKPDTRTTLSWRPAIFVNNVNPRIPVSFFNNDRTKKFKVVVQGMTTSGKLISFEKIISGKE
ncbi:MAG: hypothetical protein ACT4OJ_06480 [Bacteroidota bacterium]